MKKTEITLDAIGTLISSDQSFCNLLDLVKELDLEVTSVSIS